jgi:hypothetical protein
MGWRPMKESSQRTMAGLTARVMAVSVAVVRVYMTEFTCKRGEETLNEMRRQNRL